MSPANPTASSIGPADSPSTRLVGDKRVDLGRDENRDHRERQQARLCEKHRPARCSEAAADEQPARGHCTDQPAGDRGDGDGGAREQGAQDQRGHGCSRRAVRRRSSINCSNAASDSRSSRLTVSTKNDRIGLS